MEGFRGGRVVVDGSSILGTLPSLRSTLPEGGLFLQRVIGGLPITKACCGRQDHFRFAFKNAHKSAYWSICLLTGVPAPCPARVSMRISVG